FQCAAKALERAGVGRAAPTAQALLADRAAMSNKPPGTDGMSSGERGPLGPAPGVLATGTVVQASLTAAGGEGAEGEAAARDAVHGAIAAGTARIPAKHRRLLLGFIRASVREPCRP